MCTPIGTIAAIVFIVPNKFIVLFKNHSFQHLEKMFFPRFSISWPLTFFRFFFSFLFPSTSSRLPFPKPETLNRELSYSWCQRAGGRGKSSIDMYNNDVGKRFMK